MWFVEKHNDNSFYREKMENSGEGYMNEATEEEKKFPIAQFPPHMYLDPGHQTLGWVTIFCSTFCCPPPPFSFMSSVSVPGS